MTCRKNYEVVVGMYNKFNDTDKYASFKYYGTSRSDAILKAEKEAEEKYKNLFRNVYIADVCAF